MLKTLLTGTALAAGLGWAAQADTLKIANIAELSGAGAAAGSVWADGVHLAIDEINETGGILGMQVDMSEYDSQTDPLQSRALVQKAIDEGAFALLGTVYSSSTVVNMLVAQQNGIPQFTGSEAPSITQKGNPYIFRTTFGAQKGMPKIGTYLKDGLGVSKVAIAWANTEYGKGGHDAFVDVAKEMGLEVVSDVPSEQGQADFSADILKIKNTGAEAVFIYLTEEESARFLIEAKKQGLNIPMVGDTVLASQKVIDLSGGAAEGALGHVALSADAPVPLLQAMSAKFTERFGYRPDHNAIKGYIGAYAIKYGTEIVGEANSQKLTDALHGTCLDAATYPGVLMDICWDETGEVSRESFMVEVKNGAQDITTILPPN
ncbi:branched-chain amino acid transport system substrate-binding protein [Celeribacter baekdonensis]|uniref:Branched-chain amino acid transport system substrate-binding protein n=2 Tax=Celeribacter baekdonensis TaxID=875171 RepID=A0A1G7SFB5_9RHOB|nr:ABC transporter substrate-binding protein [Celeribacter baekdonensis]SDG21693.1 branched-chain amino acid transport system substrate-binding protein [Celeribacter baekdonensis]